MSQTIYAYGYSPHTDLLDHMDFSSRMVNVDITLPGNGCSDVLMDPDMKPTDSFSCTAKNRYVVETEIKKNDRFSR